jgi:hypothetical protein
MFKLHFVCLGLVALSLFAGCQKDDAAQANKPPMVSNPTEDQSNSSDHGPTTDLGSQTVDGWTVRATRSEVAAGKEVGVDVWVTHESTKLSAVRIWIGSEDAAGSIKALANPENQSEPAHRHAHAEAPAPLAEGSKLWVEWEDEAGGKHVISFDLKLA